MNRKEKILRDVEYINGGLTTLKTLCKMQEAKNAAYYQLFDEWQEILYDVIDSIEEDCEYAKDS